MNTRAYVGGVVLVVVTSFVACSDDPAAPVDGGTSPEASTPVDAAVPDTSTMSDGAVPDTSVPDANVPADADVDAGAGGGDFYALGTTRTVPAVVECRNNVVSGRAGDRTSLTFYFQALPTSAGTYAVETFPAPPNTTPAAAMGALARYASDPAGGGGVTYQAAPPGTVTVSLVNGKVRVVANAIPATERTAGTAGTVSAQLTCP